MKLSLALLSLTAAIKVQNEATDLCEDWTDPECLVERCVDFYGDEDHCRRMYGLEVEYDHYYYVTNCDYGDDVCMEAKCIYHYGEEVCAE